MICWTLVAKITKLRDGPPDLLFPVYHHQVIDLIESKIWNLCLLSLKKLTENVCSMLFESKGVEFIICSSYFTGFRND